MNRGFGKILHPIGILSDKVGGTAGKIMDPVKIAGKAAGGPESSWGVLLNPTEAMRKQGRGALILDSRKSDDKSNSKLG